MIEVGCSAIVIDAPLFSIVTGKLADTAVGSGELAVLELDWPQAVSNSALTTTTTWNFLNIFLLVWSKKYPTQHTQGAIRRTLPREFLR